MKLEKGKSTSFIVLQLQRDLYFRALRRNPRPADYNIALARLAFNETSTLEQRGGVETQIAFLRQPPVTTFGLGPKLCSSA